MNCLSCGGSGRCTCGDSHLCTRCHGTGKETPADPAGAPPAEGQLEKLLTLPKDSSTIHYDEDTIPHGDCSDPLRCDCMCPKCWSLKVAIIRAAVPRFTCPRCGKPSEAKDAYCADCFKKVTKNVRPADASPAAAPVLRAHAAQQTRQIASAAEYVHHLPDCPAIGGNGDADCRCGAVEFLKIVESQSEQLSAAVASLSKLTAAPVLRGATWDQRLLNDILMECDRCGKPICDDAEPPTVLCGTCSKASAPASSDVLAVAEQLEQDAFSMRATDKESPFGVQLVGEDVLRLAGLMEKAAALLRSTGSREAT